MKKKMLAVLVTGVFMFGMGGMASASLVDGLVAYYPLNGSALDASGNGNDGTVSGAVLAPDRLGNPNSAYAFDGADDFIEKTSPVNLNIGEQSWSVAAWINTSVDTGSQVIVNRYECGWQPGCNVGDEAVYRLGLTDGGLPMFSIRDDNGLSIISSGVSGVADGAWHHVAGILDQDSDTLSLFLDGLLIGTSLTDDLTTITDSGSPLEIGRVFRQGWEVPTSYFNGTIDEVRIYNRALSTSEVGQLAAVPLPGAVWLLGSGLVGLAGTRLRRKKR